ncbi:MAG: polysaccharide pyruvyl transferase CsaB [Ruminococcaceae bacterium]|nr:polysaccharide pyruvyl transferase CsaB [Oscillospiraceae bacterium]
MKILMALNGLEIGGAETHVVELSKELKRRGHDIVMASGGGVYLGEVEEAGIRHYTVPILRRNIGDMLRAKKMLAKIVREEKPDVVHAHARIPAFLLNSVYRANKKAFAFVTTAHWTFDLSPLLKFLTRWGERSLAVSDDLKRYLIENYGVPAEHISVSINGIDSKKFSRDIDGSEFIREFELTPGARRISYVSRLNPAVCAPAYALIEEIAAIDAAVPGVELIIVGGGDCLEDMRQKAEAANKKLGRRAVIVTGPRTDINRIHASAEVCVGVSRAILEPMAMEKKCVVAGQEGYIGILSPDNFDQAVGCNLTCRGCDPLEATRLRDDVLKLFAMQEDEAKAVTDYGKKVVDECYSVKTMADDNYAMYVAALRARRSDAAILGYYGFGNRGDDALLRAITDDLAAEDAFFAPVVLARNPEQTAREYGVKCINRYNPFAVSRLLSKVNLFIAGGGSLIQDVTSTKSLLYYLYMISLAKRKGLPVMLYANGIGPVVREKNKKKVAKILNQVDCITLRDEESVKTLAELGVTNPRIEVTADPAFNLTACDSAHAQELLRECGLAEGERFVCISARKWSGVPDGFEDGFANLADYISVTHGLTPVFISMQHDRDTEVSAQIVSRMKQRGIVMEKELTVEEILGVIGLAEVAVAVRLHMLIFGSLMGVPVLGIEYDPKVSSFQKVIGQPCSISPEALSDGSYPKQVDAFMGECEALKAQVSALLPDLQAKARKNAKIAVEMAGKHEKNSK